MSHPNISQAGIFQITFRINPQAGVQAGHGK